MHSAGSDTRLFSLPSKLFALLSGFLLLTGCGQKGVGSTNNKGADGAPPPSGDGGANDGGANDGGANVDASLSAVPANYAYVANLGGPDGGMVTEYTLLDSGQLSPLGSVLLPGTPAVAILAHPNGIYVYVATSFYNNNIGGYSNGISVYAVGAADGGSPGQLTLQSGVIWTEPNTYSINSNNYYNGTAFGIALDSTNSVLMCISPYTIHVFNLSLPTGALSARNPATISYFASGGYPNSGIAAHPTQPYVYVVNSANTVVVQAYSINKSVEPALSPVNFAYATQPNNSFSGVFMSPQGSYLFTANNGTGTVSTYPITRFGQLEDAGIDRPAGGPGTNAVTVDPFSRFVFSLNQTTNQLFTYTFNSSLGALSPATTTQLVNNTGAVALANEPTGNYLYVVYESSSEIGMFSVNQITSALTALGPPTVTAGTSPRGIAFSTGP